LFKGNDNYVNAHQYIKEQLFPYDYEGDRDVIKMKIWVLDGEISRADADAGFAEDDVENPSDHFSSLMNELAFLDRYVRTKDGELGEREKTFTELKQQRTQSLGRFTSRADEEGRFPEPHEMPILRRPTLLSDAQFEELYGLFKAKQSSGQLSTVSDIVTGVTGYCIDQEVKAAEFTVDNHRDPEDVEEDIREQALLSAMKNDANYVREMASAHAEIRPIILSVMPPEPSGPSATLPNPDPEGMPLPNPISWANSTVVLVNVPEDRPQVGLEPGHPSHRNTIQADEGFRFRVRTITFNVFPVGEDVNVSVSPYRTGEPEWGFDDWAYAHYYEESNSDTGQTNKYLKPLGVNKGSLPSGGSSPGALTRQRFDELNTRWKNLNRLREDQVTNVGTRVTIESMVNATVPDLLDDHINHLEDKMEHKVNYTNILRERCAEFI
jgi:hypothetical protein